MKTSGEQNVTTKKLGPVLCFRLGRARAEADLVAGDGRTGYAGYIRALENRHHYFEHGAVVDHGSRTALTLKLQASEAQALFDKALRGEATAADADIFEAHMMSEMVRMSVEDGLVMTLHSGVYRNHHPPTFERFGPDTGHDIPFANTFTEELRPLLADFGTAPGFHLILFTLDETVFSRELAPLAGFYPRSTLERRGGFWIPPTPCFVSVLR